MSEAEEQRDKLIMMCNDITMQISLILELIKVISNRLLEVEKKVKND